VAVVPSLLLQSIGRRVSELLQICNFNWWAGPLPLWMLQGKAIGEEINALVVCMGLYLVGIVRFCMRGTIVSLVKDGAQETAVRAGKCGFC